MHFCFFLLHTCMVDEYVAISCEVTRGLVFCGNRGQFVKEFIFWSGFCSTQELSGKLNGTVNIHTHIHTNIKPGLKYLYSLCSGFMEFGKYSIKGIWRRGTLRWIAKSVTLACYSNSLNSGDESACFRCCLTVWHIGHNVKWRGGLSCSVNVAKSPFLMFNVISIFICF